MDDTNDDPMDKPWDEWSNEPTRLMAEHMRANQSRVERYRSYAREARNSANPVRTLAHWLKTEYYNFIPYEMNPVLSQLTHHALGEVNWGEIAAALVAETEDIEQ